MFLNGQFYVIYTHTYMHVCIYITIYILLQDVFICVIIFLIFCTLVGQPEILRIGTPLIQIYLEAIIINIVYNFYGDFFFSILKKISVILRHELFFSIL